MKDKVVLVTGAASGIGLAIAELASKEGSKVVMVDINEEALKEKSAALPGSVYFKGDLNNAPTAKPPLILPRKLLDPWTFWSTWPEFRPLHPLKISRKTNGIS